MGHSSQEIVQPSLKFRPSLAQYCLPTITPSPVQTPLTLWGALHVLSGMQLAIAIVELGLSIYSKVLCLHK